MIRFLIDECLSPELATEAHERGFEATHIGYLGQLGAPDYHVRSLIVAGDFTFVTNNARDFLKIYRQVDVHAGLLLLLPKVTKPEQRRLFACALEAIIAAGSDLVGELVEVDKDGTVTISRYPDPMGNDWEP